MFLKFIKYLFYIFIAYLLVGFFLLPLILKPQLIKIIENETNTNANIKSLNFNPFIFQLSIEDFSLKDLKKRKIFSFDSLRINLNPTSLFYGAVELKEFSLNNPQLWLVYNKDKTINLLHIIKEKKEKQAQTQKENVTTQLPRLIIDTIKMEEGKLFYTDYTRKTPFHFSFHNIGFTLKNFDTTKIEHNSAGIRLYSRLGDGGLIDFKSKISSLEPFKIEGSLKFEASKLYTEWKYMRDVLKLEVADGKVSFFTHYALNLADLNNTKIDGLNLSVEKLRIKPKDRDKDILNLDTLYVKNANILPLQHNVKIEKIGLYGLRIKAKRYANREIDWVNYLKIHSNNAEDNATRKTSQKSTASQDWKLSLAALDLEKIALQFDDEAIKPKVVTKINELDIYAQNLTLLGEKPFDYQIKMQINGQGNCDINGSLVHKKLQLLTNMKCKDLDIVHYRPYIDSLAKSSLKKYDISLDNAMLDFGLTANVQENNNSFDVSVQDGNVSLKHFLLSKKSSHERVIKFKDLNANAITFNSLKKEIIINDIALDSLAVNLVRQNNGVLNIAKIIVPKESRKRSVKREKKEASFRVKINQAALKNGQVVFLDKSISKIQKHTVDRINIHLNKLDTQKRSWLNYRASLRVNKKGTIKAKGKVRHTPLKQSGTLSAKELSLIALSPYLQEVSYVSVDDGRLSFKVHESYVPSKRYPDLRMHGEVSLNSLFVTNTKDANSSLFSLNKLLVKPFTLELFPNRLYVDELDVDSFYVSAKIDENRSINFAQLMKKGKTSKSGVVDKRTKEIKTEKKEAFPLKIVKVNVTNGSAEFQDFSLPIKFKTNIHDLNGEIYAVSSTSGDTTYVDIGGEVDKYGSTKLKGSVDSFNPKEYTDLDFNFKNLDLHAMSGYSASFAGYEIESGKLYLDLGYEIMHAQLNATNNIMIKKIQLGKELEGENINHLPLGFVIGLLEDSDGIIDIDMPIKGDVDAPDFKYGTLVWKTLGNLIAKAVTSPFKFLGSMMGLDGEALEFIAFEFGKSNITPPQREKLDKIVKMMRKRPKITLEVNGTYDSSKDLKALKLQKLVAMVMKKSGDENIKNSKTALNVTMLEAVYKELRKDDQIEKLKKELQKEYKDEQKLERAYQNALIALCTKIQPVGQKELQFLAKKRATMIVSYLVNDKGLLAYRVKKGDVVKIQNNDAKVVKLKLNIKVQSQDK